VEVAREGDDLRLLRRDALFAIAPAPRRLDRRLDRLGAGVHRQDARRAGGAEQEVRRRELTQLLLEERQLAVAKGARGQGHAARLLDERLQDARVAVALIERRIGGQPVEIFLALDVGDPHPLGLGDDQIEGVIVARAVASLELDIVVCAFEVSRHRGVFLGLLRKVRNSIGDYHVASPR
jgi:GNAT superfamily N-acetyltransferase